MAETTHAEVERKYDVGDDAHLPDLAGLGDVSELGPAEEQHLVADYYDTASLHLARLGISLRRREGGSDAGWHLKVPGAPDERTEIRLPLGEDGEQVPHDLARLVRGVTRDLPLTRVARVLNDRVERALRDAAGRPLAVVCDDHVWAERQAPGTGVMHWREWEVELSNGDRNVLDAVEEALLGAGARPATSGSKVRRALGLSGSGSSATGGSATATTAGQNLTAYVARHRDRLLVQEIGLRLGSPEAVHHVRTSTRRLRSVLASHRRLCDDVPAVEHVRAELKWLGEVLGRARDSYVLRRHLDEVLDAQPAELVLGSVRNRLDDELAVAWSTGLDDALEALDSPRYLSLVAELDRLVEAPGHSAQADEPAADVLPDLLAREVRRLRRTKRAVTSADAPERDALLHEVRKKAKRLRYAADSAKPVLGKPARRLAKRAKAIQESLGARQDAVVARERLRELGVQAYLDGENPFTLGRLHALEERRADEAEVAFAAAWKKLPHPSAAKR